MYIEKRRVAIRLSLIGHDPIDGFVCLALPPSSPEEPRTVLELLNSALRVVPFILEDGTVILLTRLNLDWVMAGERVNSALIFRAQGRAEREEPVVLQFMNGSTIDGLIQISSSSTGSRTSDFLNSTADFYPVRTRLGTLLVNKSRVRETRLSTVSTILAATPKAAVHSDLG